MKLAEVHQAFIAGIYGLESELAPEAFIKAGEALSPQECLSVYRGSVFGNLASALADIYPAFVQCVGEKFFDALALRYVKAHPSKSPSLDQYGAYFPDFVASFEPLSSLPYARDLASLEWAWHQAFHAKDEITLDPAELAHIAEDRYDDLIFTLSASAQLLSSQFPLRQIWSACLSERDDKNPSDTQAIELTEGAHYLMVWRAPHYELRVDSLSPIEYDLLYMVNKRQTLGTILEELQSKYPLEEINQTLARAVQQSWFTGFSLAE